jgi:hypothetical protein
MKSTDANDSIPESFARAVQRIRDEAHAEGYKKALHDAIYVLEQTRPPWMRHVHGPSVTLTTLILQKIDQHSEGVSMRDITAWLNSIGDTRVAGKSDFQGRNAVSNALSKMKSQGLVENPDGKWSRKSDSQSTQH